MTAFVLNFIGDGAAARRRGPALVGVVHLRPLPGAPRFDGDLHAVFDAALADAQALAEGGCDALIVENFGDAPFRPGSVDPETVAAMALAVGRIRAATGDLPVGVNVLRNDARSALGLCAATGAAFLRVNVHTGAAVADQGLLVGRADETLRERARLGLDCAILADVHVKHAQPLAGGAIEDAARDASRRGLVDGLIVSGAGTGAAPDRAAVEAVRGACPDAPLLLGSGLDLENADRFRGLIDAAIVGTALKIDARVDAPVDRERVRAVRAVLTGPR